MTTEEFQRLQAQLRQQEAKGTEIQEYAERALKRAMQEFNAAEAERARLEAENAALRQIILTLAEEIPGVRETFRRVAQDPEMRALIAKKDQQP